MWNDGRPLLEVHDLHAGYGAGPPVVRGVSLDVRAREIVCVIGANGAGKTTLLHALYGLVDIRRGRVLFDDREITGLPPHEALRSAGIALVPQRRSLFPRMTTRENLLLALQARRDRGLAQARLADAYRFFPDLGRHARRRAGTLEPAAQRTLELARLLMWRPRIALIDELSTGLPPSVVPAIFADLRRLIAETDLTILMSEQNARQALAIADRGYVLELGRQIFDGTGEEVLSNVAVLRRSLLGTGVSREDGRGMSPGA